MSEKLSLLVCQALEEMGVNKELRQYRIDNYDEQNFVHSVCADKLVVRNMLAGSKAEGTSMYDESDFDWLWICSGVHATERPDIHEDNNDSDLVLFMEEDSSPPGYCKLKLLQSGRYNFWQEHFLKDDCCIRYPGHCRPYLSSVAVVDGYNGRAPFPLKTSGPAIRGQFPGTREVDNVPAIPCIPIPVSAKNWIKTHQGQVQPSKQLLEEIATSEIFVVPVGMHGSDQKNLEWRLSFNVPEKMLIQNFTAVQYKIYALLKMIKNEVIQPQCTKSFTSYIAKTLMLWAVEEIPGHLWREENLINLLCYMLQKLDTCIQRGFIPMYFIPDCNILDGRVTKMTRIVISNTLSSLLSNQVLCILSLPCIRTKLNEYIVPPMFRDLDISEVIEKSVVTLCTARVVHVSTNIITKRDKLLWNMPGKRTIPYEHTLADLVSIPVSSGSERMKVVKFISRQILSRFAMQQYADSIPLQCSNFQKYRTVRRCIKSFGLCHSDGISERVKFAHVLYMIGQYKEALDELTCAAANIKNAHKLSFRQTLHTHVCNRRLVMALSSGSLLTLQVLQNFCRADIQYDHQVKLCLPKALRFELYKSRGGRRTRTMIDPETLLYFLQYLCFKKLRQKPRADVAFANLARCATRWESNIEFREVALNILGYCLMRKRQYDKAVKVLANSVMLLNLIIRKQTENAFLQSDAALWHIAILLNKVMRHRS